MRQIFEIFEIFGFWREISNITRTRLEYIVTHTSLESFPAKKNRRPGCGKQMKTEGKRPEGIVFTNADPRHAGKLDDPQGGDTTMLMQQVRKS